MSRIRLLIVAALSAPILLGAQTATHPAALLRRHAPKPTAPAITPADLMTRLYIFADDSMQGRETGTDGNKRGLRYIERELTRLGLTPLGDSGGFLQEVPLVKRGWNSEFTASVEGMALAPWSDVVPLPLRAAKPRSIDGAAVIYGGTVEEATAAISAEQATGKIVVLKSPGGLRAPRLAPGSPLTNAAGIALFIGQALPEQFLAFFRTPGMSNSGFTRSSAVTRSNRPASSREKCPSRAPTSSTDEQPEGSSPKRSAVRASSAAEAR